MTTAQAIQLTDIHALADAEAPDLSRAIAAFLEQGEPEHEGERADDAMSLEQLRAALAQAGKQHDKKQRQSQAHETWKRYLAQPNDQVAPQMGLAELIVALYEKKTPAARAAIIVIAEEAPLVFGLWGGLKRVFKRAEDDKDYEIFFALGIRFDVSLQDRGDVGKGTLIYLRRRAARALRLLGKASHELYPQAAVEAMRRYPVGTTVWSTWIAAHIITATSKKWGAPQKLAKEKKFRPPYREAWERSPDPLMLLLETCRSDMAASFAIGGLRELFPDTLRKVSTEWLARLASRPLPSAHDFLVDTLEASPDFHQGKLASIGLKDAVLELLASPSPKARKYAIEYARGHAADMPAERLVALLDSFPDTVKFAIALLTARPARTLGIRMLGRLLRFDAARKWATTALDGEFQKSEITEDFLVELLFTNAGRGGPRDWAESFIKKKLAPTELPLSFWLRVLDDPRLEDTFHIDGFAFERLSKYPLDAVPADWLLDALGRDDIGSSVSAWLEKADKLPPSLDIERVRGLVFDPAKRNVAFTILGNPKLVAPRDVGLPWLLALARRADPALHSWAHRYLLTHVKPELFAPGNGSGKPNLEGGVARLFELASGPKEPEAIRTFAQLYLRCHHPKVGKTEPEAKQLNIKPAIPRTAYTEALVWPCLWDLRADVRRFGVTIARVELRRWNAQSRVYELAESNAKEVRNLAYDALVSAGDPDADPEFALKLDELDAAQIFSMTESRKRSTRDVAMELIRKHYGRLGGAERLGWLMQSADREVRLFAVRLLWEKHRPKRGPRDTRQPFTDLEALRGLLRRLLFMVPAVRSMEKLDQARAKKLPASIAKRHVIEIVRDLGVADREFAEMVAPVLGEFTGSIAKGEWQACLSALMQLRAAHGIAVEGLVLAGVEA